MKVEVTAEDIAIGKPHDPYLCPVGRALARALGIPLQPFIEADDWRGIAFAVYGQRMRVGSHYWTGPQKVGQFITAWEGKQDVEPFSFKVPAGVLTRGGLKV